MVGRGVGWEMRTETTVRYGHSSYARYVFAFGTYICISEEQPAWSIRTYLSEGNTKEIQVTYLPTSYIHHTTSTHPYVWVLPRCAELCCAGLCCAVLCCAVCVCVCVVCVVCVFVCAGVFSCPIPFRPPSLYSHASRPQAKPPPERTHFPVKEPSGVILFPGRSPPANNKQSAGATPKAGQCLGSASPTFYLPPTRLPCLRLGYLLPLHLRVHHIRRTEA